MPQATVDTILEANAWARSCKEVSWLQSRMQVAARQTVQYVTHILATWTFGARGTIVVSSRDATAADGDDEAVRMRLCLKEILFG